MPKSPLSSRVCVRRCPVRQGVRLQAMLAVASLAIAVAGSGCGTALLSARRQLPVISASQESAMGVQAYEQLLAEEPISQDEQIVALVNRVGQRLAAVADKPAYDWEFRVIAKDERRAVALPGGKIAVYEGLLPVCQDEAGLAVVISHEVAHVLARHGSERLRRPPVNTGLRGAIQAVRQPKAPAVTTEEIMQVYGAAAQSGVTLPYSPKHEAEADAIGLILMAKAGYDPSVAPEFWERLSRETERPPWLSTHPAGARRLSQLRAMLPVAMNYYRVAPQQLGMGEAIPISDRVQPALSNRPRDPREQHTVQAAGTTNASQVADTTPLNDWVAGSDEPQTSSQPPANEFVQVKSEDSQPQLNMARTNTENPVVQAPKVPPVEPVAEPAATDHPPATGDEVFYPPIAVSNAAGQTSDPFPLPDWQKR